MPALKTVSPDGQGFGKFLFGRNDNNRSNEQGVLAATTIALKDGTVLGRITSSGQLTPLNPVASDGSQNYAGHLLGDQPISTVVTRIAYVARNAGVNGNLVPYAIAVTTNQKAAAEAQMTAAGVITRY